MKKIFLLILVAVIFTTCKKDKNNKNNGIQKGIIIKGETAGTTKSGSALSDAKKILVVNVMHGTLVSSFVDIINGYFADSAQIGIATALVFLDENNKYIGTLSSQGLNLLPLCNLSNGDSTTIDLSTLTLVGTSVIPSHDPFGNEIIIDEATINSLKAIDGFFEMLAKNIDTDNDGILDVLTQKQLFITSRFHVTVGHWGLNNTPLVISESDINNIGYAMQIDGGLGFSRPNSVVLSGPADSSYQDIGTNCVNPDGNGGFYSEISRHSGGSFKKGIYTLTIDGNVHTMDYSNIDARLNLLIVYPTLHTNSDGKLVSISMEYKSPNNIPIDPVSILTDVMIQFSDSVGNQFYTTPRLINQNAEIIGCDCVKGLYSYTLATPLDISALKSISAGYDDLLGNKYSSNWYK